MQLCSYKISTSPDPRGDLNQYYGLLFNPSMPLTQCFRKAAILSVWPFWLLNVVMVCGSVCGWWLVHLAKSDCTLRLGEAAQVKPAISTHTHLHITLNTRPCITSNKPFLGFTGSPVRLGEANGECHPALHWPPRRPRRNLFLRHLPNLTFIFVSIILS